MRSLPVAFAYKFFRLEQKYVGVFWAYWTVLDFFRDYRHLAFVKGQVIMRLAHFYQQLSFYNEEEFVLAGVFVPVVFAFAEHKSYNMVVYLG